MTVNRLIQSSFILAWSDLLGQVAMDRVVTSGILDELKVRILARNAGGVGWNSALDAIFPIFITS